MWQIQAQSQARTRRRGGIALLLVIIAMGVAFVVAFGFLASQGTSVQIARNIANSTQARVIAESGLNMTVYYVRANPSWRSAKTPGLWAQDQSLNGGAFTVLAQDGSDTNGDGVVEGNSNFSDATHALTLTSTGTYNGAKHAANAVLTPLDNPVRTGMTAFSSSGVTLSMSTGAVIDSYDSSLGSYGGVNVGSQTRIVTNSSANGTVSLGTGARLRGSVMAGTAANVAQAVSVGVGATYTGTTTRQTEPTPTPTITAPDLGPSQPGVSYPVGSQTTLSQNLHVNSLQIGTGARLRISGNVTIVTEGAFTINTGGNMEVLADSSLKVYCKGALSMSTGADNKVAGANLSRLTVYNLSTTPVSLSTGGSFQGVLISPNAPVNATTGFKLYGVVMAKSLSLGTGTAFHEDLHITNGADTVLISGGTSAYRTKRLSKF